MNYEIKKQILDKIKEYDRIMLFRHVRPDGDCMGATKGMKRILQLSFPQKQILLIDSELPQYLAFMGPDDEPVDEALYADALGIVLDTASEARISNKNYKLCKEVIKIDHHIPLEHYGNINWEEEHRSSACEMVVDFYETFKDELTIDSEAATHLYTGLVTDSGRYKYSGVNGDTLRCGAALLDVGVDTDTLFARLYLEAFEYLKFKAHVYNRMQITENGVAYLYVDCAMQEQFGLTKEMASATVGCLDAIRGCICWMVFIENGDEDKSIRVRLRSRFCHINSLAEKYRGGGNQQTPGAPGHGSQRHR